MVDRATATVSHLRSVTSIIAVAPLLRGCLACSAALAAVLAGPALTHAQDWTILWPGLESCGEFLQAAEDERKARPSNARPNAIYTLRYASFAAYALGFVTGTNWVAREHDAHAGLAGSGTGYFIGPMAELENFCRAHPLKEYATALAYLRNALANGGN